MRNLITTFILVCIVYPAATVASMPVAVKNVFDALQSVSLPAKIVNANHVFRWRVSYAGFGGESEADAKMNDTVSVLQKRGFDVLSAEVQPTHSGGVYGYDITYRKRLINPPSMDIPEDLWQKMIELKTSICTQYLETNPPAPPLPMKFTKDLRTAVYSANQAWEFFSAKEHELDRLGYEILSSKMLGYEDQGPWRIEIEYLQTPQNTCR